ncbi:MAG TPA: hypothetical protein VFA78_08845 [Chloroflexota bacterium]|nr:hypothetical protein [Chloroflexota bacterium]
MTQRLVPGLLAGSLLLAGTSGVFAAKGKAASRWAVVAGQVTSVNGTAVSLTLNPGAVTKKGAAAKTLAITLSTTVKEKGLGGATGGLVANDYAAFAGVRSATGFTANRVYYSTKAAIVHREALRLRALHTLAVRKVHRASGTFQSWNGTALVITTKANKTLTFVTGTTTHFFVNGQLVTTAPTFTAGQTLFVRFERDATTKQLDALSVRVKA